MYASLNVQNKKYDRLFSLLNNVKICMKNNWIVYYFGYMAKKTIVKLLFNLLQHEDIYIMSDDEKNRNWHPTFLTSTLWSTYLPPKSTWGHLYHDDFNVHQHQPVAIILFVSRHTFIYILGCLWRLVLIDLLELLSHKSCTMGN